MVLISSTGPMKQNVTNKRRMLTATILGIICIIVPVLLMVIDPIFLIVKYKLRIAEGTMVHNLLIHELKGIHVSFYLYNVTNAEAFLAGEDDKLRMDEVGPFTFQEYRNNDNVTIDEEAGVVRYRCRMRAEFIPEESIGYPEDINVTVPNIALLGTTNIIGKYPGFVREMYKVLVGQVGSKAIVTVSAYDYLWGYKDPLMNVANKLFPGVVYYDKLGIADRLFDQTAKFDMEIGARDEDKFLVKNVKKIRKNDIWERVDVDETLTKFNDSYEGAAYPPQMSPSTPINMYRLGFCKTLGLRYTGTKRTFFGTANTYTFSNDTFGDKTLCNTKGFCSDGLMDFSPCYYGSPVSITRSHLLQTDPKLFDRLDVVAPDESKDVNEFIIEPRMGLTLEATVSLQVNLVLGDVGYIAQARQFADLVTPLAYIKSKHPELPSATKHSLYLMYVVGPRILLASQIILFVISLCLLSYSLKLIYHHSVSNNNIIEYTPPSELPLIKS